jgi:hypothetical protein
MTWFFIFCASLPAASLLVQVIQGNNINGITVLQAFSIVFSIFFLPIHSLMNFLSDIQHEINTEYISDLSVRVKDEKSWRPVRAMMNRKAP